MSSGNAIYFATSTASGFYATALWVSDGTAGGTRLIASYPAGNTIVPIEAVGPGFLYAITSPGNTDLYLTLGTPLSTHLLTTSSFGPLPANALTNNVVVLDGTLAVGGFTYSNGNVVVGAVDLTNPNPTALTTIDPQSFLSPETVGDFTALGADAFFVDANAHGVARLYRTDGTALGTTLITTGPNFSSLIAENNAVDGRRVFLAQTTSTNHGELLAIGTTDSAPTMVYDFGAGTTVASISNAANTLFIVTNNAGGTHTLWSDDGSNAAPAAVMTFLSGTPGQITVAGDGSARIFFTVGTQLWVATAGSATELRSFAAIGGTLFADGSTVYFAADDGTHHMQLWSTAGTAAGTQMLAVINPSGDADPANFADLNGTIYFSANDGVHGDELWSWNGSTASLVADVDPGAGSSNPALITPATVAPPGPPGALVSFQASGVGGSYGVTDGTLAGTATSFFAPPEVLSFSLTGGVGTPMTLTISHGTPDTTLTETIISQQDSNAVLSVDELSYTSSCAFFGYTTTNFSTASETSTLEAIGNTALAPVVVGTFAPLISGGVAYIGDRVASGGTEFFLVERTDGNGLNAATELWRSDGTPAGTEQVANLGSVNDPGIGFAASTASNNAIATPLGFAALLADDTTKAASLFTSNGAAGNFSQITLGSIGLSGTIDNTGTASLAFANSKYFFSVLNGSSIEAIATDGTAPGTEMLATETSTGQTFGDFTASGNDVYFDDGAGGALYVSDGTTGGTKKLLSSGADMAPYGFSGSQPDTPSTASINSGGKTLFYFTATQSGNTGLYFTDGSTVTTVMASGVPQNAYITAAGGTIFFVADGGTGFNTIFTTAPGSTAAAPVINPSLFPANSLYAMAFGAPQNPTNLKAAITYSSVAAAPDTFFLGPGSDTVAGGAGDTAIYASPGDLNAGDTIDGGGGINVLYLDGTGTFDLSAPATLDNITRVLATGTASTIILRPGTSIDVQLNSSSAVGLNDTIIGADNFDRITGSGNDTITVGGTNETISGVGVAIITAATEGAQISANTLEVAGGGTVALNANITAGVVKLDAATNLTVNESSALVTVLGSSGSDAVTLDNPNTFETAFIAFNANVSGDHLTKTPGALVNGTLRGTAANLNGDTFAGFNFAPSGTLADTIDITDFAYSSSETAQYASGVLTVTSGSNRTSIDIPGGPAGGGFVLSSDGGLGTDAVFIPQVFTLTTGADTIDATATNQITAADGTLSRGDEINGGVNPANSFNTIESTLQLVGPGTFDLSLPALLTGLSAIKGDTTGSGLGSQSGIAETIRLRSGLDTAITLGPGHDTVFGAQNAASIESVPENFGGIGDTVYIGDARETVQLSGQDSDVVHVTAATGLAIVDDNLEGSFHATGTEEVDGGGIVGVGTGGVFGNGMADVALASPGHVIFTSTAPQVTLGSPEGGDTIDLTDSGASGFGGEITVEPRGSGDTVLAPVNDALLVTGTKAALDHTTIDGFNFLPAVQSQLGFTTQVLIDIADLAYSANVAPALVGDTLTVSNSGTRIDTFILPNAPGSGKFTAAPDTAGTGTALTFVAASGTATASVTLSAGDTSFASTAGDDTLTVPHGALTATQTLNSGGGVNTLMLTGAGSFDLATPAVLTNFQVLNANSAETIALRPGLPMQIDASSDTIMGADAPDIITLDNFSSGNTIVVGNPGATIIDGSGYAIETISVDAATIGATIYGNHSEHDSLLFTGGGGAVMGGNIYDIATVDLGATGATFYANGIFGLTIALSGDHSQPGSAADKVFAGLGGDTITDDGTGGNTFVEGAGGDRFVFSGVSTPPTGDTIANFDVQGSDTINIPGLSTTSVSFANGTLVVGGTLDFERVTIDLLGTYNGTFSANTLDPLGGTDVTFSGTVTPVTVACFAAGTHLLATSGEIEVERVRAGERLPTRFGLAPIVWIGRRRIDCARDAKPCNVWPVRIRAGAFADGTPHTDVLLSPDHAVFIDAVLIPVRYLINEVTIVQEPVDAITYYHVELAAHAIIFAEGLACESYLDTGNRLMFEQAQPALAPCPAASSSSAPAAR